MPSRRAWLIPLSLAGCTPVGNDASRPVHQSGPSAQEIHDAMSYDLFAEDGEGGTGTWYCPYVRRHQCWRIRRNRFQCTYVDDRNRRLTAVIQLVPEEEWEFGRRWRWISGRRHCGILY
jgi:hypothetical protein